MFRKSCCFMILLVLSMSAAPVSADPAADSFKKGNELFKQGEFRSALEAFATAAKADRENKQYLSQFAQTRQILILQNRIAKEQDPEKWMKMAVILHAIYMKNDLLAPALELDTMVYEKEKTAISGLMLAETQLAMKQHADAAKTLGNLPAEVKQSDWIINALYAIALARDGKTAEAKKTAGELNLPKELKSGRAFLAASVKAIEGNTDAAMALLIKAFETTPPSRLAALKAEVKDSPELASLLSTPAFAAVLKTESKAPESSCSGGSSCATCPNRGKCSGSGGN